VSDKQKYELVLELYRNEIIEGAKLRDNLYDENNRLLIENDDLEAEITKLNEELSELHYKNKRLEEKLENLKKIKMGDATDEILKSCNVPAILRKKNHC